MVNIIIPTYKARDTLPKALDSLLAQTKNLFLVTIVQDCDGENYDDIISEYTRRGLHINLISLESNVGPGLARQAGLDANKMCDYIMFMDSDDMFMPQAVEILSKEIQTQNADVVMASTTVEQFHQAGFIMNGRSTPVQWCGSKIYRASYLREKNIRFSPELRLNEDAYFNLVACNCTKKFQRIENDLYFWRYNKKSLTRSEEDGNNFFKKSWDQYILSQIRGLQKLYELSEPNTTLIAATTLNIYHHSMKAVYYDLDVSIIDNYLTELAKLEPYWAQVDSKDFWLYINDHVKCCEMLEDGETLFFYRYRFIDWLNAVRDMK